MTEKEEKAMYETIGKEIALFIPLKWEKGKTSTTLGDKSYEGLARCMEKIIADEMLKANPESETPDYKNYFSHLNFRIGLVKQIEEYYPTDCQYEDTNMIGKTLLMKAIDKFDWRNLPIKVLQEYLRICVDEETNGEVTDDLRNRGWLPK